MNNKGFSLVEVIAVVTIITILTLVAIPVVSRTISNTRKDSFIENAKREIEIAKGLILNGDMKSNSGIGYGSKCKVPPKGHFTMIPSAAINGSYDKKESSFGFEMNESYVMVVNVTDTYDGTGNSNNLIYFYGGVDVAMNGVKRYTSEDELSRSSVGVGTINSNYINARTFVGGNEIRTFEYRGVEGEYTLYQGCVRK